MDLLESFASTLLPSDTAASAVADYFEWQIQHNGVDFNPSADDDEDLRTYLLYLRTNGSDQAALEEQVAALKRFYLWAQTKGLITNNPFDEHNFALPLPHKRTDSARGSRHNPTTCMSSRWRGCLLSVKSQKNSTAPWISRALSDSTLRTILKVMNLQTGWISMLTESHLRVRVSPTGIHHRTALGWLLHVIYLPVSKSTIAAFSASRPFAAVSNCSWKEDSHAPTISSNVHACEIP